jgi:multiple sugar transport system permease protein
VTGVAVPVREQRGRLGGFLVRSAEPRPGGRPGWTHRRDLRGLLFIAPFVICFGGFMLAPLGYAIYQSLFVSQLIGGTHFAGLANYGQVFASAEFWAGVRRVVVFAAVQVPVTLGLAFFFAVIFDLGLAKFGRFFRLVFFLPFAVPAVVASVMWSFLLVPQFGPFTRLADALGFSGTNYFSPGLILPTVIVIVVWEFTGYNMIIFYTALKAVPRQVVEAALIDGAPLWRIIMRVKLPMVRPAIVMLIFLNMIGALQLFTEPMILATFQPQAISYGFTPTIFVYNTSIGSGEYNLGAAAAVVLGLVVFIISTGSLAWRRRRRGER